VTVGVRDVGRAFREEGIALQMRRSRPSASARKTVHHR
jgi:hypothetical protein